MMPPQSRPVIDVPDDHDAAPVFKSRRGPSEVSIAPMPDARSNELDRTHPVLEWVAIFVAVFGFGLFLGAGAIVLGGDLALILWGAP